MAKINNKSKYPFDINLSLDDFLIGSDANNADFTRNYKLSGLFSTFKTALNLASIEFTFSDGVTDPSLDENDAGFFTTNSTSAPAITEIIINKTDFSGVDITSLLEVVDDQPTSFVLRVFKASVTGQVFYFAISAITDNLDNTYTLTVDNFVGGNVLQDGTTYSFVFDLAGVPSIYSETDPIFLASPAGGILAGDITNWNTAFGWGNHAVAGYLTSYTETDPVFTASPAFGITTPNIGTWNLAYGWGDHSVEGYLTSESDPVFTASPSFGITSPLITSWNAAYSWGDHAAVGYITGVAWGSITGTLSDQTDLQSALNGKSNTSHTHTFASLTSKPTTISGYGITDAYTKAENDASYLKLTGGTVTGVTAFTGSSTLRIYGNNTGISNVGFIPFYESNGTVRQGYIGLPTPSNGNMYMSSDVAGTQLLLEQSGGINGLRYYDGVGTGIVWTDRNDGAGSGLDADRFIGFGRTTSGNRWGRIAPIEDSGVMEIGRYIDFHNTDADATDNTFRIDNSSAGFLNFQGNIEVDVFTASGTATATDFIATSDRRLKTNIKTLNGDPIKLRWVEFNRISDGEYQLGLIAQEVETTNPEFVVTDKEGYKSVKYTSVFVAKMAEKDREIEDLTERIERLETLLMIGLN